MRPIQISILSKLLGGPSSASALARELDLTPGRISQALAELVEDGWVEVQRIKKRKQLRLSDAEHARAFRELYLSHPGTEFERLLAHGSFDVLSALLGRSSNVADLVRLTGLSASSVRNHLRDLAAVGAVLESRREYRINAEFRGLMDFLSAYWRTKNARLARGVSGLVTIPWQRGLEFIARVPAGIEPPRSWRPTGITALRAAGIELITEFAEYFVSPYVGLEPEHVPAHLMLSHPGDARYAAYAVLYLEKMKLEEPKVLEAARYYGATDAARALFKFISTRAPVEGFSLPSWEEFVNLASDYGVRIVTNFTVDEIRARFREIGEHLRAPVAAYLIGGGAMAFRGLKDATKDVDLIATTPAQFKYLAKTLAALGFKVVAGSDVPAVGASAVFADGGGFRLDVYCQRVLRGLVFTEAMQGRSEQFVEFGKLRVFLTSNEDIFLFKSITERPRDLDDMASLARRGLSWETIYREAEEQTGISGTIWPAFLLVKLEELKDAKGIAAPGLARLRKLAEKLMLKWLVTQRLERGLTVADDIAKELGLPKRWIEKTLRVLKSRS